MADDNNLYPPHNAKARRRGRRVPRPAHLPPYAPDAVRSENEAAAKRQVALPPAAPAFGAKKGAANALLFHQLKAAPINVDSADDEG